MSRASTETTRRRLLSVLVVLAATVPYLNSLGGDFTFDDIGVIRDNPVVQLGSATEIATTPEYLGMAYYRPLTLLTYAGNARIGDTAFGYHVVNVALHALVSLLVFHLYCSLIGCFTTSTAAALLFAVHPIHTEAVASIVGRAELLAALFAAVALLAFVRAAATAEARRRFVWTCASVTLLATGILAKEGTFMAIGLVPVIFLWLHPRTSVRRLVSTIAPYLALGLAYLILRKVLIGSLGAPEAPGVTANPLSHVAPLPRLMTAWVILWQYCSVLALPIRLSADYSFNQIPVVYSAADPRFVFAVGASALVLVGTVRLARQTPELLLATLFFLVPLALTANLVFPIGTIKAERVLYFPSIGWCLAAGTLVQRATRRHWAIPVFALLVACYGGRTWARNLDWRNNLALFESAVAVSPNSVKTHFNLAVEYADVGRWDDAVFHYRRALGIHPGYAMAAFGIGNVYEKKKLGHGALHWYERALALDWFIPTAHLNSGGVLYRLRYYDAAEAAFRTGLEMKPEDPRLLIGLALTRLADGGAVEAREILGGIDPQVLDEPRLLEQLVEARRALDDYGAGRLPPAF